MLKRKDSPTQETPFFRSAGAGCPVQAGEPGIYFHAAYAPHAPEHCAIHTHL
jgi:hypothetical protein